MSDFFKTIEKILIKLTVIQFLFLLIGQSLLLNKQVSPFISKTILAEGVFLENFIRVMETLDHLL